MPQTCILSLNTSHIGLTDNLVTLGNEHPVDFPPIANVEETVAAFDNIPQGLEARSTAVANYPRQDSSLLVVHGCPNPQLVVLATNKGL